MGNQGKAEYSNGVLTMHTGAMTDWFNDPNITDDIVRVANAPVLVYDPPEGDWQLSMNIKVHHKFKFAPEQEATVVSVVTRGVSDDTNGVAIDNEVVSYRVSKFNNVFAHHYKRIGESKWHLQRLYSLRDAAAPTAVGFLSQSPTGLGHTAMFSEITLTNATLHDARDGS